MQVCPQSDDGWKTDLHVQSPNDSTVGVPKFDLGEPRASADNGFGDAEFVECR